MTTTITLDIFSGRPNPTLTLSDGQEAELDERMDSLSTVTDRRASGSFGGLGYRGVSIRRSSTDPRGPLGFRVHEAVVEAGPASPNFMDPELERWLAGLAREGLEPQVLAHLDAALAGEAFAHFAFDAGGGEADKAKCPACNAADAPAYKPGVWNVPGVQPFNNCYNYANDQITNTFAQPGRYAGQQAAQMRCPDVTKAAMADKLQRTKDFQPVRKAGQGWYVALVVWPGTDYHWYRQDNVGCWSHKPGQTAARNVDNAGKRILDPKACDTGPYTDFCGYMITKRGVRIR